MMNISGVLVHAHPEQTKEVKQRLNSLPGVEVHAVSEDSRLVVTVEQDEIKDIADTVMHIQNVQGVLSAAMVYHHSEDDETEANSSDFPAEAVCDCEELNLQEA